MKDTPQRLHGLDALRAFALLLGVLLHASMSFLPNSQYFWVVSDTQQSETMSVFFYSIHIFRMPLFFFIAGFFAYFALQSKGLRHFVQDRLKRIAVPLMVGWPVIFTMIITAIVFITWMKNGGKFPTQSGKWPRFTSDDFPLVHLWFLYVLTLLYALFVGLWLFFKLSKSLSSIKRLGDKVLPLVGTFLAPLLIALPVALALFQTPYWIQWFGIPTPDRSLTPSLSACISYTMAFGFGWYVADRRSILEIWQRQWHWYLFFGVGLVTVCLWTVGRAPLLMPAPHNLEKFLYAWMYAAASWYLCIGLIGACLRYLSTANIKIRYLADASYCIYLFHLPIVMALQGLVSHTNWHSIFKLSAVLLGTLMLNLIGYHYLVRNTWLGIMLNGKRQSTRPHRSASNAMSSLR